jgi:hypothetical protein
VPDPLLRFPVWDLHGVSLFNFCGNRHAIIRRTLQGFPAPSAFCQLFRIDLVIVHDPLL